VPEAPRVKVCGVALPEQAAACGDLGVWAIGVVLAEESPRRVDAARAAEVLAAVPPGVARVGVFVEGTAEEIAAVARRCHMTHVQLHRPVDVDAVRDASGCIVIEAFAVSGPEVLARARQSRADLVLLDASVRGRHGGTGIRFDWHLLAASPLGRPFALAGGLTPDNVGEAVELLAPDIVDVSSGVESSPGIKDLDRVRSFLENVRRAARAGVG
jgi:phosphoribosylanthranilate isomerase